ncbi:MAG: MmcB family DNA repair protein [Pseudomonadota bacterium]
MQDLVGYARDPRVDGRQSKAALDIQRGLCRHLIDLGEAPLAEFSLANGRRADVFSVDRAGQMTIFEIKSSLADFRADTKWEEYAAYSDAFAFAVGPAFPLQILPAHVGVIVADRFSAEVLRPPTGDRLAPARRKKLLLSFALAAAHRVHRMADPAKDV